MKKMLMINGSPRSGGNSAEILKTIAENVKKGYECEIIDLGKLNISHCRGCMSCKKTQKCCIEDGMTALYEKIQNADAIAIATPVYFAAETGLLKNFIDRLYALMDRGAKGYEVRSGRPKKGIIAITCGAPDGNMVYAGMMSRLTGILKTFGANDITSGIIPASPAGIKDSPFMKDLMGAVGSQMSS
ncbi:MAG: flavodoxin family protein [Methanomassiliicoccaceae archaeon]|jgi:multimeric flavodoxin WrbA|nr:flavodoxin family protein [Methanomassiliicoccaceae archaeon]